MVINLTQYLIINQNSNLIEAVYPYYGLISLIGKTAYYQILPVKNLYLTSPEHLRYRAVKKKRGWQEKVLKHLYARVSTYGQKDDLNELLYLCFSIFYISGILEIITLPIKRNLIHMLIFQKCAIQTVLVIMKIAGIMSLGQTVRQLAGKDAK